MTNHGESADLSTPVFVSADAVRSVFEWGEAIAMIQRAYGTPAIASAGPPRTIAASAGATLRCLPAAPTGMRYFGAKLMGISQTAATPGVQYVIVLFDRQTSAIAAFVDAHLITGYRTAATSAAALDRLAPRSVRRLAVLGSGLEASMHVRAFAAIRDFDEIVVFSPTETRRLEFARVAGLDTGVRCSAAASAEEAVRGADVVLAAARSYGEKPILYGDWLEAAATVVSVGSTVPKQREIDVSVVAATDLIVCDMLHEVIEETGDMIAARSAGIAVGDKAASLS